MYYGLHSIKIKGACHVHLCVYKEKYTKILKFWRWWDFE